MSVNGFNITGDMPDFPKCETIKSFNIGDHIALVVKDPPVVVERIDPCIDRNVILKYLYAMMVYNSSHELKLIVTSELSPEVVADTVRSFSGEPMSRDPFLGVFDGNNQHSNYGKSPDYKDVNKFSDKAIEVARHLLHIGANAVPLLPKAQGPSRVYGQSITTGKKVVAYVLNFFCVGSGFVIIEKSGGMLKGLCWLIPFVCVNVFRHEIGLVWALLVLIGSYVHLYHTIKQNNTSAAINDKDTDSSSSVISILAGLMPVIYFGIGLLQLAAIQGGIEDWWGWHWLIAIVIALPIAYIPLVGTVVGVMGAMKSWGWSLLTSILLFGWPYVLFVIVLVGGGVSEAFSKFRKA